MDYVHSNYVAFYSPQLLSGAIWITAIASIQPHYIAQICLNFIIYRTDRLNPDLLTPMNRDLSQQATTYESLNFFSESKLTNSYYTSINKHTFYNSSICFHKYYGAPNTNSMVWRYGNNSPLYTIPWIWVISRRNKHTLELIPQNINSNSTPTERHSDANGRTNDQLYGSCIHDNTKSN